MTEPCHNDIITLVDVHPTYDVFKWLDSWITFSNRPELKAIYINHKMCHQQWNQRSLLKTSHLFQHLQTTRPSSMIQMSSRRRAVVKCPLECALFVNKKAHLSITGINRYYIKSASATMGTRRQGNGFNRILTIFYNSSGTAGCVCLYYWNS